MKRSLRLAAGLFLLAFLTACPSLHLQRGDEYAAKGEWAKAVRSYAKARSENPEDKAIAAKLARARVALAEISLSAGDEAVTNGDLAAAWKHLANAVEAAPKDPRVDALRARVREATATRIRGALGKADYDAAYADLQRLQTQDAGNAEIGKLTTEIALSVLANAQKLESQGAFFQARQRLMLLSQRQPSYAKEAKSKIASLNTRWANHLRDLAAKDERKKRWTSAYVRRAMAAGITQNHTDRKQKERLQGLFLDAHGVVISTQRRREYYPA